MLVDNDVTHDSRVRKSARSAARAGFEVLVIGLSRGPRPREQALEGVRVLRVSLLDAASRLSRLVARAVPEGSAHSASARTVAQTVRARARDGSLLPVLEGRVCERLPGRVYLGWRRIYPEFEVMARAMERPGLAFEPDLVHVHDFPSLPAGARIKERARKRPRLVYDAHEYVGGLDRFTPARRRACTDVEVEHAPLADRIVTVSPVTAELLQRDLGLAYRPESIVNAPQADTPAPGGDSVRARLGLGSEVPLLAYAGVVTPARGLSTVVEALPRLPGAHFVLVTDERGPNLGKLLDRASDLGCAGRVHVLPYVDADRVPSFLRDATLGITALVRYGNAEATLPNKLFEYMHARIPVAASEHGAVGALVRDLGIGETFEAGNPLSFATAVGSITAAPERYTRAIEAPGVLERYSWEVQGEKLLRVYDELIER